MAISREELAGLSQAERDELSQMLCDLGARRIVVGNQRRRRIFLIMMGGAVISLALWIVILGLTLPPSQTTKQWRLAWIGFDVAELLAFAVTGWAARNSRQLVVPAMLITGTLLMCDAWFDVVLSWSSAGRWWSVVSAVVIEIPLALLMWNAARRLVLVSLTVARSRLGISEPPPPLRRIVLFDPIGGSGGRMLPVDHYESFSNERPAKVAGIRRVPWRPRSIPALESGGTESATPDRASSTR